MKEHLLAAVLTSTPPDAWQACMIFADWLEERGSPEAIGWRLLAELQKWPGNNSLGFRFWHVSPFNPDISRVTLPVEVAYYTVKRKVRWNGTLETCLVGAVEAFSQAHAAGWRPAELAAP